MVKQPVGKLADFLFRLALKLQLGLICAQLAHRERQVKFGRDRQQHRLYQRLAQFETAGVILLRQTHSLAQRFVIVVPREELHDVFLSHMLR